MNTFAHSAAFALRAVVAGPAPVPAARLVGFGARLECALQVAVHRAWTALEVSLAGGPLWRRHARPDDEPLREYLRPYLQAVRGADRREALRQLRAARGAGALLGNGEGVAPAARLAQGFTPPADTARHERRLVAELEAALRGDFPELARVTSAAPDGSPPLLPLAARHFFRQELAVDAELGFRLPAHFGDGLSEGEQAALDALVRNADRVLPAAAEALETAPPTPSGTRSGGVRSSSTVLPALPPEEVEQFDPLPVGPESDPDELHDALAELAGRSAAWAETPEAVAEMRRVLAHFRALPPEVRDHPLRLDVAAEVALRAGEYGVAAHFFRTALAGHETPAARAAAHYGHFRALLGQEHYAEALGPFLEAVRLHPQRFGPFPIHEYVPEMVLAAGPGGVDFLCRHYEMPGDWVVRVLPPDPVGKEGQRAAELLRRVGHNAVPRVVDVGRVGAGGDRKTYVVFDSFPGTPLDAYVRQHGPFSLRDALEVLREIADGLAAAHEKGVRHGALEPARVVVRHGADGWAARVGDFAPALHAGEPASDDYRAPEPSPGKPADLYGWGRVACFALFGVADPAPRDWKNAPPDLATLLRRCTAHDPRARPHDFGEVVGILDRRAGRDHGAIGVRAAVDGTAAHAVRDYLREPEPDLVAAMPRGTAGGGIEDVFGRFLLLLTGVIIVGMLFGLRLMRDPPVAEVAQRNIVAPPAESASSTPVASSSPYTPPPVVATPAPGGTEPLPSTPAPAGPRAEWPSVLSSDALTGWQADNPGGGATAWRVVPGEYVEVRPGAGGIRTATPTAGAVAVSMEFWLPPTPARQAASGVVIYGTYEVSLADSFGGAIPLPSDSGALLGVLPPSRNASRPAGVWQNLEVLYRPPAAGRDAEPGRLTVALNSIEVLRDVPTAGPSPRTGAVGLRDGGWPVRFRNVRVRPLGG